MPAKKKSKAQLKKQRSENMKRINAQRTAAKNGGTTQKKPTRKIKLVIDPKATTITLKKPTSKTSTTSSMNSILNKTTNDLGSITSLLNKPVVRRKAPVTRRTTTTTSKKNSWN